MDLQFEISYVNKDLNKLNILNFINKRFLKYGKNNLIQFYILIKNKCHHIKIKKTNFYHSNKINFVIKNNYENKIKNYELHLHHDQIKIIPKELSYLINLQY